MSKTMTDKDRITVRVNLETLSVHHQSHTGRIGVVTSYTTNEGARTPSGGKFESHRITVSLRGDDRKWVGQVKSEEMARKALLKTVILRPAPVTVSSE